jgi:transposase
MVGCDLHEAAMVLRVAVGTARAKTWTFDNNKKDRANMIRQLKALSKGNGGMPIIFAYEACGLGYTLRDELVASGIRCVVLPSTALPKSPKAQKNKSDVKDADRILALLRAFQGGQELPEVWVPPQEVREDREVVRARAGLADKLAAIRIQIRSLFKRFGMKCEGTTKVEHREWLKEQCRKLPHGIAVNLQTLLRQMEFYEQEVKALDKEVAELAQNERYADLVEALRVEKGVGVLVAMVFLTEIGDCLRFKNRREVGSYLGLAPSMNESGEATDRKGHITHQGPGIVRKMLCQAAWARNRCDPQSAERYQRIVAKNPKHKKIATVAMMRQLSVRLWHHAVDQIRSRKATPAAASPEVV